MYERLDRAVSTSLRKGDLAAAAEQAELMARMHRSSRWYSPAPHQDVRSLPSPEPKLSQGKLRHDIEQFTHLRERGILRDDLSIAIARYRSVSERVGTGSFARRPLDVVEGNLIGDFYNRIVWRPSTPRVPAALSSSWDRRRVEAAYVDHPIGIVVIDDVLTQPALASLRRFCIESTVWFENRYGYGRLGAFFRDGFNCPLLVQIAEEFQSALPKIIDRNPLQQLWAFKNEPQQPATLPHADFAMINVNFWLAPEEANLDENTGGMIIYDVPTPPEWNFATYNTRGDVIADYLMRKRARWIRIPYRSNRAIIFNSRYFHKTDVIDFSPKFEDRRVNVTLLYGRHDGAARM